MELPVIEDQRGVDISQIRHLLAMSIEDRVSYMVHVTNTLVAIRANARFVDAEPGR